MNRFSGVMLLIGAVLIGIWWWRRSYVPSPLDQQFADLAARAQVGNLAQNVAFNAQPVAAMVGSGWGTTMVLNPANPNGSGNNPGTLRLNMRFAQPGGF